MCNGKRGILVEWSRGKRGREEVKLERKGKGRGEEGKEGNKIEEGRRRKEEKEEKQRKGKREDYSKQGLDGEKHGRRIGGVWRRGGERVRQKE